MEAIVLAHGGTAGTIIELGLVVVPLVVMGILSLIRKRKTASEESAARDEGASDKQ